MGEAVIVDAQRSAIGRGKAGKGWLSGLHPATLSPPVTPSDGSPVRTRVEAPEA